MTLDTVIRSAAVVGRDGVTTADIGIADGRIAAIGPELEGAAQEIEGRGLHALPGVADVHVHLNEPGRTDWEGWASGTRALAAGGATLCADMPFNALPPTIDAADFAAKLAAAQRQAHVDFALWGGIVPGRLDEIEQLAACGVLGFKAFMCATGLDEFPGCTDDLVLHEAMGKARELGLPVLVHAESESLTAGLTARIRAAGRTDARSFLATRPPMVEAEAIGRAIVLAEDTGCSLHIVHVSTGRGVALVRDARARGVDVTCETCPHYLVLDDMDVERLGAVAKCTPPLRAPADQAALWDALASGDIPMVVSDHSPASEDLKRSEDFFAIWGGIAGAQSTLELLLTVGHLGRGLALPLLAERLSGFATRRFGVEGKGALDIGSDADVVLVELGPERRLAIDELLQRRPTLSPYLGRTLRARVRRTLLRGTTVYADGAIVGEPSGRLVRAQLPRYVV